MVLDLFIIGPIIVFTSLGLRDGIVRKLAACIALLIGLIVGHYFMHNMSEFLIANAGIDPSDGPTYGFLTIFLSIAIIQGILYKVITGGYKIKGIADRLGGTIIGFFEGLLFLSAIFYILTLSGTPSRATTRDSRFYKSVVNIAPQILDLVTTFNPEDVSKPKGIEDTTGIERKK